MADPNEGGQQTTTETGQSEPQGIVNQDGTFVEGWTGKLGDEFKDNPNLTKYKKIQDLSKSHINAQKMVGKDPDRLVELPSDQASDEAKAEFYKKLGVPDDPNGYEFELSKELEGVEVDEEAIGKVKQVAQKYGVPADKFNGLLNEMLGVQAEVSQAQVEQMQKDFEADYEKAETELRKEWGDDYDRRVNRANRVLHQFGGQEAVEKSGLANNLDMVRFLDKIADSMSEDKLEGADVAPKATPAQIESQIDELMARPAYMDGKHPQHQDVTNKVSELFKRKAQSA